MALSETMQALAAELRGSNPVKSEITPAFLRHLENVTRQDLQVPTREGEIPCYLYMSKQKEANCPLVINIHGGGFVRPHLDRDHAFSAMLADCLHCVVLDVDYHLAPEYPYPVARHEVYDTVKWAFTQLAAWDTDPARVSMIGHSAGATLIAAALLEANQTNDFHVCLQVLDYPALEMYVDPTDKDNAAAGLISVERGRAFNRAYTNDDLAVLKDPYCSPGAAPDAWLRGLPPALILVGERDNFRFEDLRYGSRMAMAGVPVTMQVLPDSNHGFITHCAGGWKVAHQRILDTIRAAHL